MREGSEVVEGIEVTWTQLADGGHGQGRRVEGRRARVARGEMEGWGQGPCEKAQGDWAMRLGEKRRVRERSSGHPCQKTSGWHSRKGVAPARSPTRGTAEASRAAKPTRPDRVPA